MTNEQPKDAKAANELVQVLMTRMSQMTPMDLVGSAFIQGQMAQASIQAIVNLLKTKNVVGIAELEKALADSYEQCAKAFKQQGLALPPSALATPS